MADNLKVSKWLFNTLDYVGVSQTMREYYQQNSKTIEVLHRIQIKRRVPFVIFGSSAEGTTSPGMNSDVDMVFLYDKMPIFEHLKDCPRAGRYVQMISDVEHSPGYVRLRLVINRNAARKDHLSTVSLGLRNLFQEDKFGWLVLGGSYFFAFVNELHASAIRHGPALTIEHRSVISTDIVHAHHCNFWPSLANEWIERNRRFGWPSPDTVQKLQKSGFLLVYVDHPKSDEKDIECRISFSYQERQLMRNLNETQYKCYVFLKMIKNDLIKSMDRDSITSYHLKTCLFYTIENNLYDIWSPGNLWNCIILCLNLLLEWVGNEFCPNYFIPKENMLLGKVEGKCEKVKVILRKLIDEGPGFLHRIKTDNIGKYFSYMDDDLETKQLVKESKSLVTWILFQYMYRTADEMLNIFSKILQQLLSEYEYVETNLESMSYDNTYRIANKHLEFLHMLDQLSIKDQTKEETQKALSCLKSFLQTSLACHYASLALQTNDEKWRAHCLAKCFKEFKNGLMSDLTSSRLKYATFLYRLGEYEKCEEQLIIVEKQCANCIIKVSLPRTRRFHKIQKEDYMKIENPPSVELKDFLSFPVIFLPTERVIVPDGLIFEMFRSSGVPPGSRSEALDFWYDWAMVDSKSYLYFLWYLLDKKAGKPIVIYRDKTFKLFNNLKSMWSESHRETVNNLISWNLVSECQFQQAFVSLKVSFLEMEKFKDRSDKRLSKVHLHLHNAAKWHISLLLFKLWKIRG